MTREEAINFGEMFLEVNNDSQNSNTYKFVDMAIKALKQEPRWIPTSVRPPEKNGSYLVQYCSFDGTARIKFMTVDHYSVGESWLHEEKNRKVEAWMPLPELYQGSKVGWSSLENIREKVEKEPE